MINRSEADIMKYWSPDLLDHPVVSIRCLAYNHEQFIEQCLDGFLMQETSFPFEIVVHDDASTDSTAIIIHKYEVRFPHILKPIYETENQLSKADGSLTRIICHAVRGQYVAVCEGDDFWTDPTKLQKQYDYMEQHPECALCTHNTIMHNLQTGVDHPFFDWTEEVHVLSLEEIFFGWHVHTSSYFCKKTIWDLYYTYPPVWCGDYKMLLVSCVVGQIVALKPVMSQYNYCNVQGITCKNVQLRKQNNNREQQRKDFLNQYNEITNHRYIQIIQDRIQQIDFNIHISQREQAKTFSEWKQYRNAVRQYPHYKEYIKKLSFPMKLKEYTKMHCYWGLKYFRKIKSI